MGMVLNFKTQGIVINFLETYRSEDTIRAYESILKDFFNVSDIELITDYKIKNTTYQNVQEYILTLTNTKAKNTVKQRIGCLRALFNYALDEELIEINPFADNRIKGLIRKNCVKEEVSTGRALSIKEIDILINTIRNAKTKTPQKKLDLIRDELLINFMLRTGCRKDEAVHIKRDNIIYKSIEEKYFVEINGKGNKIRYVQLTNKTIDDLNDWKIIRNKNTETIFGLNCESNINKILDKWAEEAKLGNITVHDLRRTFCTNLIKKGLNIRLVQQLMGHASLITTEKYIKDINYFDQNLDDFVTW